MQSRNRHPEQSAGDVPTAPHAPADKDSSEGAPRISSIFLEKMKVGFFIEDPDLLYRKVIQCVRQHELDPAEAVHELQDHYFFFGQLIEIDGLFLQLAPEKFQSDLALGRKASLNNYLAYEYALACHDDEEITLKLIQKGHWEVLRWSSPRLRSHLSIVTPAIDQSAASFLYIDPSLRTFDHGLDPVEEAINQCDNREYYLELVKKNGLFLQHGSETIRRDAEICKEAVTQNWLALEFALACQDDQQFMMDLLDTQGLALRFAPKFQNNLQAACRAVDNDIAAILYVDPSIRAEVLTLLKICCDTFHGWFSSIRATERTQKAKSAYALFVNNFQGFPRFHNITRRLPIKKK